MKDSCCEDDSDEGQFDIEESSSETENADSETSEDDDELNLDQVMSKVNDSHITLYSSNSEMTLSSIPPFSKNQIMQLRGLNQQNSLKM